MLKKAIVVEVFSDINLYTEDNLIDLLNYYGIQNPEYFNYKYLPSNSIICINPNTEKSSYIGDAKIYFPIFSHIKFPIKPGEWVWVLDDSDNIGYSYWLSRVVGTSKSNDVNFTHNDRDYNEEKESLNKLVNGIYAKDLKDPDEKSGKTLLLGNNIINTDENEYEFIINNSISNQFIQKEAIPKIFKRPDEHLIEGSNNSYILLGTDRIENELDADIIDINNLKFPKLKNNNNKRYSITGKFIDEENKFLSKKIFTINKKSNKKEIGCIDIVTGKKDKNIEEVSIKGEFSEKELWKESKKILSNKEKIKDYFKDSDKPNFSEDFSRIYLSMKNKVDYNFKLKHNKDLDQESNACIALKSDQLRLIARKDIKLIVQENDNTPENKCAAILIKKDGNITIIPSQTGIIKLGGEDADKAILCSPISVNVAGQISSPPIVDTMGGSLGTGSTNGIFATKILIK